MNLKSGFCKILGNISGVRFHRSISTLPIGSWFEIHRTTDPMHIAKNGFLVASIYFLSLVPLAYLSVMLSLSFMILGLIYVKIEKLIASKIYDEIYDEFIRRIGLNKEYLDWWSMTKRIALLKCECAMEPSSINLAHLDIELKKLEKKKDEKQVEYTKIIAQISKSQGYRIDPKKVSVLEFYSYING